MFSKKSFFVGLLVGCIIAGGSAVYASQNVQALIADVHFKFNGTEQALPDGYVAIGYNGHTYVPARFVAEQLGAQVGWDGSTNTVTIDSSSSNGGGSSTSSQTAGHYNFSNYSMKNGDLFTTVIGEVTNNDTVKHDVDFKVNFYDVNGKLLGTATGVVLDLGPGEKKSFEASADSVITGINNYSFQIDTEM